MRTNPQNPLDKPNNGDRGVIRTVFKWAFRFTWRQKKWLASLAVILFVFGALDQYGQPITKDVSEKPCLFIHEVSDVVVGRLQTTGITQEPDQARANSGILGGPMVLSSLVAPIAQASVDFSADDAFETYDLLLVQDNAVMSAVNPSGTAGFSGFYREVRTYIVKQGDNPEKIAIQFGINTYTLLWANNLRDGDIIKPGQELIIMPINGVRVKVGTNDTLANLAKKYNGDLMEIIAFNDLPLDGAINTGSFIIIPDGEMQVVAAPKPSTPARKYAGSTIPAGWMIIPTTGYDWGRIHGSNGVDIANPCGTPIYAAAAGRVILSDGVGYNGGYGKYIKIQHRNGVVTLYAHASSLLVSTGEQVAQGQLIMYMGSTGRSTGCHLHFEVRGATNPLAGKARNY